MNFKSHFYKKTTSFPWDLFFIHGNLGSHRWWYPVVKELRLESSPDSNRDLILVDLPGCGPSYLGSCKSFSTQTNSNFLNSSMSLNGQNIDLGLNDSDFASVDKISDELTQFILLREKKRLRPMRLILVGHSAGGLIASVTAAKLGDRIKGLVLLSTASPQGVKFEDSLFERYRLMGHNIEILRPILAATIRGQDPAESFFNDVLLSDAFYALQNSGTRIARALRSPEYQVDLSAIRCSKFLVTGEEDSLISPEHTKEYLKIWKEAQVLIQKNVGHCLNIENPIAFAKLLSDFAYSISDSTGI